MSADDLAVALEAIEVEERRRAASLLVELPVSSAIPLLLRALGDEDWRVRKEATFAAVAFRGDPELVAGLVPLLGSAEDIGLRNAVASVLSDLGSIATRKVVEALDTLDADGRKLAVEVLGKSRDGAALAALAMARHDDDPNVRQAAVEGIARLGPVSGEPVEDILLRCLDESDPVVQLAALAGLHTLHVPIPWDRIEALLDQPMLRQAAITAAADSDSPQAPPALARALVAATGVAFEEAIIALAWISEQNPPRSVERVAEALAEGAEGALHRVARAARGEGDESVELRGAARVVAAIGGAPGALAIALDGLDYAELEPAARRALLHLGPVALPDLIERLRQASEAESERGVRSSRRTSTPLPDSRTAAAMLDVVAVVAKPSRTAPPPALAAARALDAVRGAVLSFDELIACRALDALSELGLPADLELCAHVAQRDATPVSRAAEGALATLATRYPDEARAFARQAVESDPVAMSTTLVIGALGSAYGPTLDAPGDLAFLETAARTGNARTRRAAVVAIAELGDPDAVDVLGVALVDEERDVQLAAAHALGRLYSGPASRRRPGVDSTRPSSLLELVARSNDASLVAATVDSMTDPPPVRAHEIDASLADFPPDELVTALGSLAKVSASAVAVAAVDALGRMPPDVPGRMSGLASALHHPEAEVAKAAMLKLHGDASLEVDLTPCLHHASPDVRRLAAMLLGTEGTALARAQLADRAAQEADGEVRAAIAAAIAMIQRHSGGSRT